jgi:hypothetical protein
MSFLVEQRQRPEPRRRGDAANDDVAAAVEWLLLVIGSRRERDAVAGADRQFAGAGDGGAGVVDVGGAAFGRAVQAPILSVPRSVPRVAVM